MAPIVPSKNFLRTSALALFKIGCPTPLPNNLDSKPPMFSSKASDTDLAAAEAYAVASSSPDLIASV